MYWFFLNHRKTLKKSKKRKQILVHLEHISLWVHPIEKWTWNKNILTFDTYRRTKENINTEFLISKLVIHWALLCCTDRHTGRQTLPDWITKKLAKPHRQPDKHTEQQTDRQMNTYTVRQTNIPTDKQTNRQTNRQTDRKTDRLKDEQTERQTNGRTNTQNPWQAHIIWLPHEIQTILSDKMIQNCEPTDRP